MKEVPVARVRWQPCWRVIPTRYMAERLLGKLVDDPEELEILELVDAMTNERLRVERDEVSAVLPEDRRSPACQDRLIMAAFSYKHPEGSRFSDGSYGVFYAADTLATAIEETKYHAERFMKRTKEAPTRLERSALRADLDGRLHDIRGKKLPDVYDPDSYVASQAYARALVNQRSYGLAYDSVRRKGGECVAVFRPPVLSDCRPAGDFIYEWDGAKIAKVKEIRDVPNH